MSARSIHNVSIGLMLIAIAVAAPTLPPAAVLALLGVAGLLAWLAYQETR